MSTNPTSARSRRPAGTPAGGQFAPEAHAEPEVELAPCSQEGSTPVPVVLTTGEAVQWLDTHGHLHRTDGPAVEWADGSRMWLIHGELHRTDGPAREFADGSREWWVKGQRHRTDGPAIEEANGDRHWFRNGERHRTDGPAIERANGSRRWWVNGNELTEEEFRSRFPSAEAAAAQDG